MSERLSKAQRRMLLRMANDQFGEAYPSGAAQRTADSLVAAGLAMRLVPAPDIRITPEGRSRAASEENPENPR